MKLPATLAAGLEAAVNRYLALDPEALRALEPIAGRLIALELTGLDVAIYLIPEPDRVAVLSEYSGEPHTRLRGTPLGLAQLGVSSEATRGLFAGEVTIDGDTDTGERLKHVLQSVEIDWEEQLSHVTGDVVAHQLGRAARELRAYGERTGERLREDLRDYLQEEAGHLPTRTELETFLDEVDTLRSDIDRLEARLRRIAERSGTRNENNTQHDDDELRSGDDG